VLRPMAAGAPSDRNPWSKRLCIYVPMVLRASTVSNPGYMSISGITTCPVDFTTAEMHHVDFLLVRQIETADELQAITLKKRAARQIRIGDGIHARSLDITRH